MVYKQRPFLGCHIALYGFNDSEATHIKEIAELNGMICCYMYMYICIVLPRYIDTVHVHM